MLSTAERAHETDAYARRALGLQADGDALEILPKIEADIVYADPLYAATRGYEAAYKVIDQILGEKTRPTSPFTAQGGAQMIDVLLERTKHVPLVVLSFGNETVSLHEQEQVMAKHGRATRGIEIPYARLAALSKGEKSGRDRELLVLGWDPDSALLRRVHSGDQVDRQLEMVVPGKADGDLAGAEAATPLPLVGDRLQESREPLTQVRGPEARGALRPQETGIDDPEAVLVECPVDRDDVGEVSHDPTVS